MKCRYCRKDIAAGTILCPVCRSYQARWRNWLPYIGGCVAFIALIGSLSGYLVTVWSDLYSKHLAGDGVRVLSFKSSGKQLYFNTGGRDIYLSHVELFSVEGKVSQTVRPSFSLKPGILATHDEGNAKKHEREPAPELRVLRRPLAADGVSRFYTSQVESRQKCTPYTFFSVDDPAYLNYRRIHASKKEELFEFPADAVAVLYNWRGDRLEHEFAAAVVLSLVQEEDCKTWYTELDLDKDIASNAVPAKVNRYVDPNPEDAARASL